MLAHYLSIVFVVFMEGNDVLPGFPVRCIEHYGLIDVSAGLVFKPIHKPSNKVSLIANGSLPLSPKASLK